MQLGILMLLPLLGALVIAIAPVRQARWIALAATTAAFVYSIFLALAFEPATAGGFDLAASASWLTEFGIGVDLGVDSVALLLVLLTTFLMPLCVWGSFSAINERVKEYYAWLVALEAAMIGVFVARDLIFFYICFEFTLVPMYFLIAIYGGENRARAATKFFIFTFTGSLIALAGLLWVAWRYSQLEGGWSFSIPALTEFAAGGALTPSQQALVLLALMAGFAVKVPLFPVHTWLPLAHTEAPTAGSVILAAVLLKLGTYGLYRFVLPMVPDAVVAYTPFIAGLAIVGILYAALICWVQTDVKRLVAYSSVSHLGFCVLGLFALNPLGAQGSVLYMINHGLSTGALFFLIGMIYERYHTRDMERMSGLARRMPVWAFFMIFFVMSSVGLPGLNGFVSEFLCLIGAFAATGDDSLFPGVLGPWYAAAAGVGMIIAAMYLLMMAGRVVFGPLKEPPVGDEHGEHKLPPDLTPREIGVLVPIAVLCVVLGVYPKPVTDALEPAIEQVLAEYPQVVPEVVAREREALATVRPSALEEGDADG
ncbi:MAG: complex I subunit 4 family protein [Planctomycetota bacterium]|jgi:NADH-quinone oxidoreductase subunit M